MGLHTFTTTTTITIPSGVFSVDVKKMWGGGGGGAPCGNHPWARGGGGGGGGGFASRDGIPVTPGNTYTVRVAEAVAGATDGDYSEFVGDGGVSCKAVGGKGAKDYNGGLPGQGAAASDCIGTIRYSGGNGGTAPDSNFTGGAGGGGAAGDSEDGHVGGDSWAGGNGGHGDGGATGGGDGSDGAGNPGPGPGSAPGGGGGGSAGYPGGGGARGEVILDYAYSYEGSIPIGLGFGVSDPTVGPHHGIAVGSIPIGLGLDSDHSGPHHAWFTGSISLGNLRLLSNTYNARGLPDYVPGPTQLMDFIVPYDVLDGAISVSHLGGMGITAFHRSSFILNTADHDGTCTWYQQVIAQNTSGYDQTVQLMRVVSLQWDPDNLDVEVVSELVIPAGTTEWTVFLTSWTPTSGSYTYFWQLADAGYVALSIATLRIFVKQIGATKTIVWRPLVNDNEGVPKAANEAIAWNWGTPGTWALVGGTFYWKPSLYTARAMTLVMEATTGSSYGGVTTDVTLWDLTTNERVSGTLLSIVSGGSFRYPLAVAGRKEFNTDLLIADHLYQVAFRRQSSWGGGIMTDFLSQSGMFGARLYMKLQGVTKCEVLYRVSKAGAGGPVQINRGSSRARVEFLGGNSILKYVKNETCSAADFYWNPLDPTIDYWITDDGHLTAGEGPAATEVAGSNARQLPEGALLPILSSDWKDVFVSGDYYTWRSKPVTTGGDANMQWTLVCMGLEAHPASLVKPFACLP